MKTLNKVSKSVRVFEEDYEKFLQLCSDTALKAHGMFRELITSYLKHNKK